MLNAKRAINMLFEYSVVKDYRTDKTHYVAAMLYKSTGYEEYGVDMPNTGDTGQLVLLPVDDTHHSVAYKQLKGVDFHTKYHDLKDPNVNVGKASYDIKKPWSQVHPYNKVIVNHATKTVTADTEPVDQHRNRREGKGQKNSYTILNVKVPGNVERKIVVALIKVDPAILEFNVEGTDQTVRQFIARRDTPVEQWSKGQEAMTFYHGTSMVKWKKIKVEGLRPGHGDSSYSDLIPGYSDLNVYLSTTKEGAANYASRSAIYNRSDAAILKVVVRNIGKFVPDEDNLNWLSRSGHPQAKALIAEIGSDVHFQHNWRSSPHAKRIMDIYLSMVKKSLAGSTIAYRGIIPRKDITLLLSYKPVKMVHDPERDEFEDAMALTRASVKSGS
jgi:hypothetical protein